MLVRCLYASRPVAPQPSTNLDRILAQSRRNNVSRGITGLLCATSELFVQVLEGGRDEVSVLLSAIFRDDRHRDVRLLAFDEIAERQFGNWTMGQIEIAAVNPGLLMKYQPRPCLDPYAVSARSTMALLSDLVAAGAITHR
ncbi:MAG: BLUF domain-containing protein [Proteobacteria bacterium]|nr:BLUF domain-containing protein [Pseudomonadota bacterium]